MPAHPLNPNGIAAAQRRPPASCTIAHLTDPHLFADPSATLMGVNTYQNLRTVVQHMHDERREPALLLATGDLTQDGSRQGYEHFLEQVRPLGVAVHALPGNHDAGATLRTTLGACAAPVVDLEHWRIVLLDSTIAGSNDGRFAEDQLALLERLARSGDPRHVLVAMHHQPVPMHSAWLDTMAIANAQELFDVLGRFRQVRALLWGHVHQAYDGTHALPGNSARTLRLMATPATCFQFSPRSAQFSIDTVAPGYRWIDLHADGSLDTRVVRIPGPYQTPELDSRGY